MAITLLPLLTACLSRGHFVLYLETDTAELSVDLALQIAQTFPERQLLFLLWSDSFQRDLFPENFCL